MLKQKLSDKFSNIFSRDKKQKLQQNKRESQQSYFDESYFDCKLAYNPHKLSLIKVIANITVGPDAGMPMMVNCKWLIKKNNQYSQIQGVTSSCYQPCIQDVGCSILVQIKPLIEGKIYSGPLITKQTGLLEMGSLLQTKFTETKTKLYYEEGNIEMGMKVEAVFGRETEYSNMDYPQQGRFIIRKQEDSNFEIQINTNQFKTFFWITKQFPTFQFIRKSYNSIIISFTQFQSMRIAFKESTDREILGLLLRTLTANSTLQLSQKQEGELTSNAIENLSLSDVKISSEENIQQKSTEIITQVNIEIQNNAKSEELLSTKGIQRKVQYQIDAFETPRRVILKSIGESSGLREKVTDTKQEYAQGQAEAQIINNSPINSSEVSSPQKVVVNSKGVIQLELKVGQLNSELSRLKKDHKDLMKNYNLQKQSKFRLQNQNKKLSEKLKEYEAVLKDKDELERTNQKLKQDNRFYRNEVTIVSKSLKKKESDLQHLNASVETLEKKLLKYEKVETEEKQQKQHLALNYQDAIKNESENWRKLNNELLQQNQELKSEIEGLQNMIKTLSKKLESLQNQKSIQPKKEVIKSPVLPVQNLVEEKEKTIKNLQFKLANLEMLLRHRSGDKGNGSMGLGLQKIINNLTEAITEKEEQMQQMKKVNKQLLEKLNKLSK